MAGNDGLHTQWTGHDLFDLNGDKIGVVGDVRYGDVTGSLKWLVVKTGLLGSKRIFVPAGGVRSSAGRIVVSYTKDRVKSAPHVKDELAPTAVEEQDLCAYYGLDHLESTTEPCEGPQETQDQRLAS
jgi:hypothetical protein